ncbi:hypothetical protein JNB62_15870 [Microbacterium jejuense]|uniref:Homeodomain-like domain-containing protein n=1 Tax=Microbacterium jejuense TaxID=1263637 RepID=A0ABS7HQC1_9MICO|nr:hypothetical protein [Microbacterium jejuense]MBW9095164.1 hypothetical protein [Microbacterium jejuense]
MTCPADHKHDHTCYIQHGCRDDACKAYRRDYQYWYRHMVAAGRQDVLRSIIDARGARRRLQALTAIGWSQRALAHRLGVSHDQVHVWLYADRVTFATHEAVATLYDTLSDREPPQTNRAEKRQASYARTVARRNDWARPIDWDDIDLDDAPQTGEPVDVDEVAVQLVVDEGTYVPLTRAERHIAVTALNGRRYNDQEIAHMLRVSDRTIQRDREYLGLPAHPEPYEERFAA